MSLPSAIIARSFSAIIATGAAMFLATASHAASPLVLSGPSPFALCKSPRNAGKNYVNAEVEPSVAVNPSNTTQVIAAWQQDRWSNGGSRSLLTAYSLDGGTNWRRVVVPSINKCSGGKGELAFDRSSDPWVTVAPDGTSYLIALSTNVDRPDGGRGINAMLVSRSSNGGATWGQPTVLRRDTDGRTFNDKETITADPRDWHYVYATWDQIFDTKLPQAHVQAKADGSVDPAAAEPSYPDGVLIARERQRAMRMRMSEGLSALPASSDYYMGPAYFARTTDGGVTWEPAKVIYDPGINAQTLGNQTVVLANGDVLMFFNELFANGRTKLRFVKSTDHGETFGNPISVVESELTSSGAGTPDLREPVRDGNLLFDVAVDPSSGNLYAVWQDGRDGDVDKVAFTMSSDGGKTWSTPAIISKTPANSNPYRAQSFSPSVEVAADSKVYVTYYDFRFDLPLTKATEKADFWAISCQPATAYCSNPGAWGNERRLTTKSFNILNAPFAGGYFLGDYQGLVRQGAGVRAVFAIATTPRKTDVVTTTIP